MTRFLTEQEAVMLNMHLIQTGSPDEQMGVKFPELLDSAINRPQQSAFGEDAYPTIFTKAAALFESLAKNRAFHNANKRTAFSALYYFLRYNRYMLKMAPKQAEDFVVDVVNHKYAFEQIVEMIESHSQK
ncbi:type II toxin-antitoxin system death-on-curing family toxin [Alicyclobacillus fodiniaquatilis]|uniref:Type II toxin-antitoxin system death-on-curing family toxin n=1 Tax=Alicyclobacillus fodiniaquatilis TaxID=1661150 RepID=A0ABW4JC75_9BACL